MDEVYIVCRYKEYGDKMGNKKEEFTIDFNNMDDVNSLINKLVKEMIAANTSNQKNGNDAQVYGFNIKIDPNGISIVERENNENMPHSAATSTSSPNRSSEPLIDLIERPGQIVVIAELRGSRKEEIHIGLENVKLKVEAHGERNYSKSIILPANVNPTLSEAKFNNGILEISLKKGSYNGKANQIKIS